MGKSNKIISNYHLEKYTTNDFALYYELVSDENVMKMITERALTLKEARNDMERMLINNDLHELCGSYKIIESATSTCIGFAKLELEKKKSDTAEVGYMLLPVYWGKGIASQIVALLIERAEQIKQLTSLWAIIDPINIPSRKALTKHGFIHYKMEKVEGLDGEILVLELC